MSIANLLQKTAIFMVLVLLRQVADGQVRIKGTVYDRSARIGMPGVSVRGTSGAGTVTDSSGHYSIVLPYTDSLSFSYQGKSTVKFPVREIRAHRPFDMSLHVSVQVLPTVEVSAKPRSYRFDSLETRNEYRRVFDYEADYLSGVNGAGVGLNLDALFGMGKIKRMETFRRRLEEHEQERYVSYRFNKALVSKITGLESPALDSFMSEYRPTYGMLMSFENEYDYYRFIKEMGRYFAEDWNRRARQ